MKQLLRLLSGIIPLLFLSCDYSPSGSKFEDVNPNPQVTADITLHDYDKDTLIVRGNKSFYFNVFLPGREYYGHKLQIDDKVVSEANYYDGGYFFVSEKHGDGYHTLKYSAYANSGTGSLADKYRAEAVEVYRTWVVLVDNSMPVSPAITSIEPEDGRLRINWEPYTGRWFKRLELRKSTNDGYSYKTLANLTDRNVSSWVDDSYIGGDAIYSVVVHLDDKTYGDGKPGTSATYSYPLPTLLSATYNETNEVTITFSSTPFYNNFESYYFSSNAGISFTVQDRTDTVHTFRDPGFGKDFYSSLITFPKGYTYYNRHELPSSYFLMPGPGTAWGPFADGTVYRSTGTDRFYVWQYGTLHLVDASTMKVAHTRNMGTTNNQGDFSKVAFSVNGRHAYLVLNNEIHQVNPATLQTTQVYKIRDLLPHANNYDMGLSVSNDNRLLIAVSKGWNSGRDSVYVVDMNSRKLLTKTATENGARYATLSPDGKAMRLYPYLYAEQPNGTWQQHSRTSNYTNDFMFHPSRPWYTLKKGRVISFYSNQTGEEVKSLTTGAEDGRHEIDAGSGYLYETITSFPDQRHLYVYNIDTGQLVRKLKLAPGVAAFVYKDRIISPERFMQL